ncbi:MAG: hypothetical protein H6607_05015 [Flavobacteriales bacterium]|nr:hypothetical protein [Flavobacteriales bacterium]
MGLKLLDLDWQLDRLLSVQPSDLRIALKPMTPDLGNGITSEAILTLLNSKECFDFDYIPEENDRLLMRNNHSKDYFAIIFRENKWEIRDYYTTRMPSKGVTVLSETIYKGYVLINASLTPQPTSSTHLSP